MARAGEAGTAKVPLGSTPDRWALKHALSPGQAGDAPQGRERRQAPGPAPLPGGPWCRDRAYAGHETRRLAEPLGLVPVVPPNPNRVEPWEDDRVTSRRRHEVERLLRRLKGDRRVGTRDDKLDGMFLACVHLALIFDALASVNRP